MEKNNRFHGFKTRKILDKAPGNIYKCKSAFVTETKSANEWIRQAKVWRL